MDSFTDVPSSQKFTLGQMQAFLAAAEASSFSAAAKTLKVSQPSLSRGIAEMEEALSCVLFSRTKQGIELSEAGHAFREKALRVAEAHAQAQASLHNWRAAKSGRLKLVGSATVMPVLLSALVDALKREYGDAALEVDSAVSPEVRRRVLEGESTLGVSVDAEEHPALRYTPVLAAQLGLMASPRLALPESITSLDDLMGVPILKYGSDTQVTRLLIHHGVRFDSYFASPVAVSCMMASFDLAHQGQAAMVCSGISASNVRAAGLKFIPLPGLLPVVNVSIVSRQDATFDPAQERLRCVLRAAIHDAQWHPSVLRTGGADPTKPPTRSADTDNRTGPAVVHAIAESEVAA